MERTYRFYVPFIFHQPRPVPPRFKWRPFTVVVRSIDAKIRSVAVGFPHCTCGIPTLPEALSIWLVPPLFCVLLGFITALLRPRAVLAWAFLGAMLALSQVQFWPDSYTGFQMTSTPMTWGGWFRIFGVGYRALVQSLWVFNRVDSFLSARPLAGSPWPWDSGRDTACRHVQAAHQIAWSEDYRHFVAPHRFFAQLCSRRSSAAHARPAQKAA